MMIPRLENISISNGKILLQIEHLEELVVRIFQDIWYG